MRLYYFTSSEFAISNIAHNRIKISRISQLNDPYELLAVNLSDPLIKYSMEGVRDILDKDRGLICFSKAWSNPLMWGHYAEKHKGIVLGFDVVTEHCVEIEYSEEPVQIGFNKKTNKPDLNEENVTKLVATKFKDWSYEQEVRVWVQLDHSTCESGNYFYKFDEHITLREVILGAKCESSIKDITPLIERYSPSVKVTGAELALDTFKVIPKSP